MVSSDDQVAYISPKVASYRDLYKLYFLNQLYSLPEFYNFWTEDLSSPQKSISPYS